MRSLLEPGTYRSLVGQTATGAPIEADLSVAGQGWQAGNYATLGDKTNTGVGAYVPDALAAGSGCMGDEPTTDLASLPRPSPATSRRSRGARSSNPPTPGQALGHDRLTGYGSGSPTTARRARATASPRPRAAPAASATTPSRRSRRS